MAELPLLEFDESRASLLEPRVEAAEVPEHCVLCFFHEVADRLALEAGAPVATLRGHPVLVLEHRGERLGMVLCGAGAPVAALVLEEAIALGFGKFVACGPAGVLDQTAAGHVLLPFAAVRDEGTSFHYLPPAREVRANPAVVRVLEETLREAQRAYLLCRTWTTDGLYRQTPERVERRRQENCLAVEMETAALLAVAQFRGVQLGQYLLGEDPTSEEAHRLALREVLFWLAADACLRLG